jgi:hypothetical protein
MKAQQKKFGYYATKLLKDNNNKLPKRNECSDKRHRYMFQKKQKPKRKKYCTKRQSKCRTSRSVRKYCPNTCKVWKCWLGDCKYNHQDATLAKFAILNF